MSTISWEWLQKLNTSLYIPNVCGVGVVTIVVPLLVDEHALANASGIQMGARQQLFRIHTELFDAHVLVLVQASNNEQTI